jgi:CRP-like cAMP-binding protein
LTCLPSDLLTRHPGLACALRATSFRGRWHRNSLDCKSRPVSSFRRRPAPAFFLIESGEATVFISGRERTTLKPGDYFGEIALIDEGTRMATIIASSELVCYELTYGDFRPLVEKNGVVGWKLLQRMVKMLRATRGEAHELGNALAMLRHFDERYPG